jgi:hypothetical protein
MDYEQLATQLEATGDGRPVRRFAPPEPCAPFDLLRVGGSPALRDCTTGVMDLAAELAMLGRQIHPRPARVTFDAGTGRERCTDHYRWQEKCRSTPEPECPPPS